MTTMTMTAPEDRLKAYAGFVKLEHTIFSLPLIYAGALLHGRPSMRLMGLILLAAVGGRTMAMGFNRIIDAKIDGRNPRTRGRELPRGAMHVAEAWLIVAAAGALYAWSAAAIAPICVQLAPIPVALFVIYPYLKRMTSLAHLGLGLAWSMAPLGGWLAASHSLERFAEVRWLWLFSVLWVTGFDIIYATMDEAFDRGHGLRSIPADAGKQPALTLAKAVHAAAFLMLGALWANQLKSAASFALLLAIGALFLWQHAIADRRPEFAFFQLNGAIGFLVLGLVLTA